MIKVNTSNNNNGLAYTKNQINANFKIKVFGYVNGKKVNTLVGVSGLIKMMNGDVEMINKMLKKAFNSMDDKYSLKLRRGIKVTFYYY